MYVYDICISCIAMIYTYVCVYIVYYISCNDPQVSCHAKGVRVGLDNQ